MHITQMEAEELLAPYIQPLIIVFDLAWSDWLTRIKENPTCCKRGRSNYIWDQIIYHAKSVFGHIPDHEFAIYPYNKDSTHNFVVKQSLLFRVKKGRSSRKSSNVPTAMSLGFHDPNESLPEIGLMPRIEIQYELDKLESSIIDIVAVARDKNIILWDFSLKYRGQGKLPAVSVDPNSPNSNDQQNRSAVKKRVKLKPSAPDQDKKVVGK